ncbi:MAG: PEFG-CTERM sorting domain-containing protein [Nitrosopumilaceae archaeon]
MKSKSIGSFFVVLTLVAGMIAITPSAFADHAKVDVSAPAGTATPGCEETNSCFIPAEAIVDVGGEVTWTNDDTAAHTATSGNPTDGPDGVFDSSLFGPGKTFTHKFEEAGTFNYFCMVHPWMKGVVTVQAEMEEEEETYANAMSSDGSVNVEIESSIPAADKEMSIHVTFTDADGNAIDHVNYAITAMQDETEVLSESDMHEHAGEGMHVTDALASDSPVDIQVTILGIGLPDEEANWTGPKGDVVSLQVVPEFGTIAALVLAISIVSIIAVTAKTRVIPKL